MMLNNIRDEITCLCMSVVNTKSVLIIILLLFPPSEASLVTLASCLEATDSSRTGTSPEEMTSY